MPSKPQSGSRRTASSRSWFPASPAPPTSMTGHPRSHLGASNCPRPPPDPVLLSKAATGALEGLILDGIPWARAGVNAPRPVAGRRRPAVADVRHRARGKHIGALLRDTMNRFGTGAIVGKKRDPLPPKYTTEWAKLPVMKDGLKMWDSIVGGTKMWQQQLRRPSTATKSTSDSTAVTGH